MTLQRRKAIVLTAVLAAVAIVAIVSSLGLASKPPGTQTRAQTLTRTPTQVACVFPSHNFEYVDGELRNLSNNSVVPVESTMPVDLSRYPDLVVRQGYRLERFAFAGQGGDAWALVFAVCESSGRGFAIEPMNGTQGGFVFGPITSAAMVAEYAEFMGHDTQISFYDREHQEVKTDADFQEILGKMQQRAREQNYTLQYGETPPFNHSTVVIKDGVFLVHRIFFKRSELERLEYWLMEVKVNGEIRVLSQSTFVTGVPGIMV